MTFLGGETEKKKNISKIRKTQKQSIDLGLVSNPCKQLFRPSDADISHLGILYKGNRFQDTILFSKCLEKKYGETGLLYFYRGLSFRALGSLRQAVVCFSKVILLDPRNVAAHNYKGEVLDILGDLIDAAQSFRDAISIDPSFSDGHHNLGLCLKRMGNIKESIESYSKAIKINPKNFMAHNNLGNALYSIGRVEDSIESFKQAININPEFSEVYFNIGNAFRLLKMHKLAIEHYRTALDKNPDLAEAYNYLGTLLGELGYTDSALAQLEKAIGIKPGYAIAHNNAGKILFECCNNQDALREYTRALLAKPDYIEAFCNRAVLYFRIGDYQNSIRDYLDAVKADPKCIEAYYGLGNVWNAIGESSKALTNYNKAIQINPEHQSSKYMVASLTGMKFSHAPVEYIRDLFDNFAKNFDETLITNLKYQGPNHLLKLFSNAFEQRSDKYPVAVDLGCGTGLTGELFRDHTDYLIGVDLSKNMIQKAEERKVYDSFFIQDISSYLYETANRFDFFICADVFIYFGDLSSLFKLIKNRSQKSSTLAFWTEHSKTDDFYLSKVGRFCHSRKYILSLLKQSGFKLISFETNKLRKEGKNWVEGDFYIAQR